MIYNIEIRNWGRVFTVPCSVVDDYLKNADPVFLKILLCVLSMGSSKITSEKISEFTGADENTIDDALVYWNDKEIICISGLNTSDGFTPTISDKALTSQAVKKKIKTPINQPQPVSIPESEKNRANTVAYSPSEMAALISNNPELKYFFDTIQTVMKKLINNSEQRGFIYIYEYYGFEVASILLLADYCVDLGKGSIAYIKSVAKDWHERGITAYIDVEKEIIRLTKLHSYESKVSSAFGITNKLTPKQKTFIQDWQSKNMPIDLVELAYQRCMDNTSKLVFKYIDTILQKWHSEGVKTIEQAESQGKKKRPIKDKEHSYDINEIDDFQKNFLLKGKGLKQGE